MTGRQRHKRRGFTLAEILVTIVILGIGFVAVSELYLGGLWSYQKARYLSLATQRAQYELENIQYLGHTNYKGLTSTATAMTSAGGVFQPANNNHYTQTHQSTTYARLTFNVPSLPHHAAATDNGSITITPSPSILHGGASETTNANIASVEITINWDGPRHTQSNVDLLTYVMGSTN